MGVALDGRLEHKLEFQLGLRHQVWIWGWIRRRIRMPGLLPQSAERPGPCVPGFEPIRLAACLGNSIEGSTLGRFRIGPVSSKHPIHGLSPSCMTRESDLIAEPRQNSEWRVAAFGSCCGTSRWDLYPSSRGSL